ncbi:hypothetical protein TNCV_1258771 [Trichonephila clavipes]|nr:hypothetical protein TNCV_1258771 [Trichonephila clavipes]
MEPTLRCKDKFDSYLAEIMWRKSDLSFRDVTIPIGRNQTTAFRFGNRWVQKGCNEFHAGFQRHPTSNIRESRHVVWPALKDLVALSWN